MSDGANIETTEASPQQSGKFARAWEAIRSFRKSKGTNPAEGQTANVETQEKPKQQSLQEILDKALAEKGIKAPEFKSEGVSEFHNSNERFDPHHFEMIRRNNGPADGYIIGVGTSSIFSSLELFSSDAPPKGIVLINIDPATIKDATKFVGAMKEGKLLYKADRSEEETDINDLTGSDYSEYQQKTGLLPPASEAKWKKHQAQALSKLAKEGKIAVLQQDMFDIGMLQTIKDNLPGIESSRNVVYLSNVGDWIRRQSELKNPKFNPNVASLSEEQRKSSEARFDRFMESEFTKYQRFNVLNPQSPNYNYFVDTSELPTGSVQPYAQRITHKPPDATRYFTPRQS